MAVQTGRPVTGAAGAEGARGPGRPPEKTPGRIRRALSTHWYAWTMVAPVVAVIGVIIGYPLVR
ncbi:ABC transporter permease, partial [Streptomyces sp. Ru87]